MKADLRPQIIALREHGMIWREIGERLGISTQWACELGNQSDGSAAKARKYRKNCEDCGTPIRSDSPSRHPQRRCVPCHKLAEKAEALWTRETIIESIQLWAKLYGEPPASSDWGGRPTMLARERRQSDHWPPLTAVTRVFGLWSAGIEAAGYKCRYPLAGQKRVAVSDEDYRTTLEMRTQGKTWQQIAAHFGLKSANAAQQRGYRAQAKERGQPMSASLRAETVIEREIARYEERKERAEADATEAGEQAERLKLALKALTNGKP